MRTGNEKQNFKNKQTKFMQQHSLFTSLWNRHTLSTAALPDGLCSLIFSYIAAWDHPLSIVSNFLAKVCFIDSLVGAVGPCHTSWCLSQQKSQTKFCFYLLTDNRQPHFRFVANTFQQVMAEKKNSPLKEKCIWPLGRKQNDLRLTSDKLVCVERKD